MLQVVLVRLSFYGDPDTEPEPVPEPDNRIRSWGNYVKFLNWIETMLSW